MASGIPPTARAQDVQMTIVGTVQSGTDTTGVFGTAGDLTGQPFTLTFVYDSTKGMPAVGNCSGGGPEYYSSVVNTASSIPGTASLQIGNGGGQFDYNGAAGASTIDSYALRYAQTSCFSYSAAGVGLQVNYGGAFSGTAYVGASSGPDLYPVPEFTGILSPNADWTSPIDGVPLTGSVLLPFLIDITLGGNAYKGASGYLSPSTFSVTPISVLGELLGCGCVGDVGDTGGTAVGQPINLASGNMYEQATDYTTAGANPLRLTRTYNSKGNSAQVAGLKYVTLATSMAANWRTNYDRYLQVVSGSTVNIERPLRADTEFHADGRHMDA